MSVSIAPFDMFSFQSLVSFMSTALVSLASIPLVLKEISIYHAVYICKFKHISRLKRDAKSRTIFPPS